LIGDRRCPVGDADRRVLIAIAEAQILGGGWVISDIGGAIGLGPAAAQGRAALGILGDLGSARELREEHELVGAGLHVVERDRLALGLVGIEQSGAAPAFDCRDQLPGKIDCVGEAGVKAESAGWRILMRGIAADEDAAVAIMLG